MLDLQRQAFAALLEKYRDYGTNPAAESLEAVQWRLDSPDRDYWFILADSQAVGLACVRRIEDGLRISPIGLLPEYRGKGLGHQAMILLERQYPENARWELGTILEEPGLCRFYESLGYRRTGAKTVIQPGMTEIGYEKKRRRIRMTYQAVFFDIDNTLLLKKPSVSEKVFETLAEQDPAIRLDAVEKAYAASELWQGGQIMKENETGIRMPDQEYVAHVAEVYRGCLGLSDSGFQAVCQVLSRDYKKAYILAPGVVELLEWLKGCGVPLGIVSNHHSGMREVLEEMGLAKYFGPVVLSEEVGLNKPDPAILELACRQIGSEPKDSLYVGDHPFDILCAHAAHMPVVWMPVNLYMEVPEFIDEPEHTAGSLTEVLHFLMEQEKKG